MSGKEDEWTPVALEKLFDKEKRLPLGNREKKRHYYTKEDLEKTNLLLHDSMLPIILKSNNSGWVVRMTKGISSLNGTGKENALRNH